MAKTTRRTWFPALIISCISVISAYNANSQHVDHWETVVEATDIWKYFPGVSEPPANWTSSDFDDSSWQSGRGGIGYGDNDDATTISPVASLYLRMRFSIVDRDIIFLAVLNIDFDDGFVAYLNGHEIARENIGTPGTRPLFNQFATLDTYEARLPSGGVPESYIIQTDTLEKYLTEGENILAIQVHNCNATSSDLSSATWLTLGLTGSGTFYRDPPEWFVDPLNQYSYLPVIMIDTRGQSIPDKEKIIAACKIIDNGPGLKNNILDPPNNYNGLIGIEIRGQSSKNFPKKSYGIELRDSTGSDIDSGLLGMPPEEDWVLHAPYADKTILRNALTYYLGAGLDGWQPGFRFCSLYLNGSYNGIYMLIEKIKRDDYRVDISKLDTDERAGDDLTGGYIFKVDKTGDLQSYEYFTAAPSVPYKNARNYTFSYVYPDADVIAPEQKSYLRSFLTEFQNKLNGNGFRDQEAGYQGYIDIQSFIDFQIIQELTNNVDGYRFSTYFYKEKNSKGGKLHAGPIWDFDLGYGNVNFNPMRLSTSGWLYKDYGPAGANCMHWWARLMEDEAYASSFVLRWKELREGILHTDSIMDFIDNTINELGNEIHRNFEKWPILGKYVWPNSFVGKNYTEEVVFFKDWIRARLDWIDNNIELTLDNVDNTSRRYLTSYPNPAKDILYLKYYVTFASRVTLEIYDLMGRKYIIKEFVPDTEGYNINEVEISQIPEGSYIVSLRQGARVIDRQNIVKIK